MPHKAIEFLLLRRAQRKAKRRAKASDAPKQKRKQRGPLRVGARPKKPKKEPSMPSEFEFLDKHFYDTDIPEVAAQAARERFGFSPEARTSTVIYDITWKALTDAIVAAVDNYNYGDIFNTSVFASMGEHRGNPQWNIILTGLRYVNATKKSDKGIPTYEINDYNNGTVIVNALVAGNNPPMLGEIVHLQAGIGTFVGTIKLKNEN